MPEAFSKNIDNDSRRISFTAFSEKLSILECICYYLKSSDKNYAEMSRMLGKDQRTIWTVCKRAERKLGGASVGKQLENSEGKHGI
jgi:DNA-binding CsgD family transcriptional regulator